MSTLQVQFQGHLFTRRRREFRSVAVILLLLLGLNCAATQNVSASIGQGAHGAPLGAGMTGNGNGIKRELVTASSSGHVNGAGPGQVHGPNANGNSNGYPVQSQPQTPIEPLAPIPPPRLLKRCSSVLIGKVDKVSTEYIWELKGFLEFMDYLKDFDPTFELNSERVNFTTMPELGGTWNFRIFKEIPPTPTQQQQNAMNRKNFGGGAGGGSGPGISANNSAGIVSPSAVYGINGHAASAGTGSETPEMSIQAVHNWFEIITDSNPPEKRGINYKCVLEIKHGNRTVLQEAKTTIADIQFKFISNGRYRHQYIYTFKWRNIQTVLGSLITPTPGNADVDKDNDVLFHFTMIAHLPSENRIVSTSCDPFS